MSVPKNVTIAVVEDELPAAQAYAQRHGWGLTWLRDQLVLLADGRHPADKTALRLHAALEDYRAFPPAWSCFQQDGNGAFQRRFPKGGALPQGAGSLFHPGGVLCAPFNRLAYKEHSGPHADWGGLANWLKVRGHVRATVLAEMLAQIILHLNYSPGWQ
jgi:hypothetical protein